MKIYDNKRIKPDYISFIGINYNMPGQYITDCYYNYHFYNILSLDEIDSIDYDSIIFIVLDNTDEKVIGKEIFKRINKDKCIITNIESDNGIYIDIPRNNSDDYDEIIFDDRYVSDIFTNLINSLLEPGIIGIDIYDLLNFLKNKKKTSFHSFKDSINYEELKKNSSFYVGFVNFSLKEIDNEITKIESTIKPKELLISNQIKPLIDKYIIIYEAN